MYEFRPPMVDGSLVWRFDIVRAWGGRLSVICEVLEDKLLRDCKRNKRLIEDGYLSKKFGPSRANSNVKRQRQIYVIVQVSPDLQINLPKMQR